MTIFLFPNRDTSSGITALSLGDAQFRKDYNLRYAYVTGAMYREIAKGLFFPARANKLYDLYRQYNSAELLQQRLLSLLGSRNSNTSGYNPTLIGSPSEGK